MPNEFVNPNWHVIFIHYPLALLTVGVLIELFSRRANSTLRTAAHWMILLGALLMIPAATTGLYALRDVVSAGPINDEQTRHEVIKSSPWLPEQWLFMKRHLLLMSIATGLFLLGTLVWMGAGDDGRRRLRWPVLIVMLVGLGVMSTGAWYSGEAVYRYGTAVERTSSMPGSAPAGMVQESPGEPKVVTTAHEPSREEAEQRAQPAGANYYLPPLQLHLLLVGLTVALALGAMGLSFRRWSWRPPVAEQAEGAETASRLEPGTVPPHSPVVPGVSIAPPAMAPPVFPARFWLLAFLFGLGTAVVGLWVANDWKLNSLLLPLREPERRADLQRMFYHVIFGLCIVILTLLLAIITRVTRRARGVTIFFVLLLLLAVAGQVWLGILLLFDTDHGPLTGFNA